MPFELRACLHCGTEFRFMAAPSSVRRGEGKFCSVSCSQRFNRTGKRSNNWHGGRKTVEWGYIAVYAPDDPNARPDGYVLEHRQLMAKALGRPLERQEVVHHKNGKTDDNRLDNLELLPSQSQHIRKHAPERARS